MRDPAPGATDKQSLELRLQAAFDEIASLSKQIAALKDQNEALAQAVYQQGRFATGGSMNRGR